MILLNVQSVVKHFGPSPVLDGVSFELRPGDRIGLVGPNGCGKTTLLRTLIGEEELDRGSIDRHPSARLRFLEQHPQFEAGHTVWDVAMTGLDELIALRDEAEQVARQLGDAKETAKRRRLAERYDFLQHELEQRDAYHLDRKVQQVLQGLGLSGSGLSEGSFDQPVEQLSGGQQNRLLLARLLLSEPDVLLLDEPSNHLDLEATAWLEDYLGGLPAQRAWIVVSHDRFFLDKVTNRTLELFRGTVDSYSGNFSAYWRQKAERLEVQRRAYEKQQTFIAKAKDFIRRNHHGLKHQQAEDRRKKLARLEPVEIPREISGPPMRFSSARRSGDVALRIEHASKAYDCPLFTDLSFDIQRGERWGVLGPNASGKTTLLRSVVGQVELDEGEIITGHGVAIGYLDQLTAGLDPQAETVESIRPVGKAFNEPQRRDMLARFGLHGDIVFQSVESLSGGERSRAGLARLAAEEVNFLVLDEPTNHLDIWARDALEQALKKFEGTVLLVSHDRYFLNRIADHLLVVENGRFHTIHGNYDTYLHFVRQGLAGETSPTNNSPREQGKRNKNGGNEVPQPGSLKRRRFPYRKIEDLEAEIAQAEAEIEACHLSLAHPDVYRDGDRVRETKTRIADLQQAIQRLQKHWEEAVELN